MRNLRIACALLAFAGGALQMHAQGVIVGTDEIPGSANNYSRTNHSSSVAINRDSSGSFGVESRVGSHYLRFGGGTGNNSVREFTGWLTNGFLSGHVIRSGTYTVSIEVSRGGGDVSARDTYDTFDLRLVPVGDSQTEIGEKTIIEPYVIPQEPNEWNTVVVSYTVPADSPLIGQPLTWAIRATFPPSGNGSFGPVDNIIVHFEESGDWITDYQPLQAPIDLLLGSGAGRQNEGALLRSRPGDFTLQTDGLRYSPTTSNFLSSTALAVVNNYANRQDFSLESEMTLVGMTNSDDNRVGFSVLGGPHSTEQPFNTLEDSGFYGLIWYPSNASGDSLIQIREGFNGTVLNETVWTGRRPFSGGSVLFHEDFEDIAAANAAWDISGAAHTADLWEFGEPVSAAGPASAVSGVNVAATGLDVNYPANTDAILRSPVINLGGAEQATLTFYEFTNMDNDVNFHSATVSLLNPSNNEVLAQIAQRAEVLTDWEFRQYPIPQAALDHGSFIIEFRFRSDPDFGGQYPGWFIDDVMVASQEVETYTLQAEGVYDLSGILDLTFTLTDADNVSESVTATIIEPHQGNLFGIGGRTRDAQSPTVDFHSFAVTLGDEPGEVVPSISAPFDYAFGSDEARDDGSDFLQSNPAEWSLTGDSLQLAAASSDFQNSLAATRVWNFEPGNEFFLATNMTLTNLAGGASENRVGIVLFGEEDPSGFSASNDGSYYTLEWTPNTASGGSLSIRQGFNGATIATTDFGGLDNPPEAVVGESYEFRLIYADGVVTGVLLGSEGRRATVSGPITVGPTETRFGLGARHRTAENAVWDFHTFSWSETLPLPMPLDYQFGTAGGRDSDEDFTLSAVGHTDWSLESQSLQVTRGEILRANVPNATASAGVFDYGAGGDFVVRSTVSASEAEGHLAFNADGGHIETPVTGTDLGISGNNPRTIEAWAYARNFDNNATVWTYGTNGSTPGVDFGLKVTGTQDRWVLNRWNVFDIFFDIPNSANRWIHFAVVHTGENTYVYVDGVLAAQDDRAIETGGEHPFRIGWWFHRANTTGLNGSVRDVRVWNVARSAEDIQANMNAQLQGNEPGLVAYWPIDEGEGDVVADLVDGNHGVLTAANESTGLMPVWEEPQSQFGLSFLGASAGSADAYTFQWEPLNVAGGGVLRLSGPGETGSLASVDLASVAGAPTFVPGATYTMQLNGFFNPNGSLSLQGILHDGLGGEVEVATQVASPVTPTQVNWFGMTGRHPTLNWRSFEMGTPAQLGIEPPPPPEGMTFADWRIEEFGADAGNDAISGPQASPAGDGLSNLLKYAFGLPPLTPATLSDLTFDTEVIDGGLRMSYWERRNADDIDYQPEVSQTLASWSTNGITEVSRVADGDFDLVTVEATLPNGAERGFLRVLIIEQ